MRFNYDESIKLLEHGGSWVGIFNDAYGVDISYAMENYNTLLVEAVKNSVQMTPLKVYLNRIAMIIEGI